MKEKWITIAKGIGILLVIFEHSLFEVDFLGKLILIFHMPLFFFLSGLTLNTEYSFKEYFGKRIKGILLPYGIYGVLRLIWILLFGNLTHNNAIPSFTSLILGLFVCVRNSNYSVGLWFLPLLFISETIIYLIMRFLN